MALKLIRPTSSANPDHLRRFELEARAARGFREVRLIHGKGTGTQRAIVRSVLERHPVVERFFDGAPDRGAWGATVVVLKA